MELINPSTGRFKREITISLRTTDVAEGKRRDLREAARIADLFKVAEDLVHGRHLPAETPSLPSADEVEAEVLSALLAADEFNREEGDARRQLQTPEERAQWPDLIEIDFTEKGMAEDHYFLMDGHLTEELQAYREALARRNTKIVEAETKGYLRSKRLEVDTASPAFRRYAMAVLQANVRAYEMMIQRQRGEVVTTPAPPAGRGPKLSEAYDHWRGDSGARGARRPAKRTLMEAENVMRRFKEFVGDARLGDISKDKARGFRDALARIPTRLSERQRRLPLPQLFQLDLAGQPAVHAETVNKQLNILAAIVSHAEHEGLLDQVPSFVNPFRGIRLKVDRREAQDRQPFSNADLESIFTSPVFSIAARPLGGGGEAAFWLPILALMTGARQGELVQLRVADLKQDIDTGIWCIDVNTDGGRSVKTASSKRVIPLHPALQDIGLLRYRSSLLDQGSSPTSPLFPFVRSGVASQRGAAWSKWFNRYLRTTCGIEDEAKVFHSFRHTFKRMCRTAELSEEQSDALTGHKAGGIGRSYGSGFGLETLAKAIAKVMPPPAVGSLLWSKGPDSGRDRGR